MWNVDSAARARGNNNAVPGRSIHAKPISVCQNPALAEFRQGEPNKSHVPLRDAIGPAYFGDEGGSLGADDSHILSTDQVLVQDQAASAAADIHRFSAALKGGTRFVSAIYLERDFQIYSFCGSTADMIGVFAKVHNHLPLL